MLELPTIKASDEFDNKSVEGRLTQEKTINLGVKRFELFAQLFNQLGNLSWAIHFNYL